METAEKTQIPAETQAARIFDLICDILKYKGPDIHRFVEEKIKPVPKAYLKLLFRIVLISFIPSFALIWLGFSVDSPTAARWLLFFGGMWRAACTLALLFTLAPVGLIIEAVIGGKEGSGKRWAELISGTFIGELFFTLIAMVLIRQIGARLDLLPILIMASMILGMIGGAFGGKGFIAPATGAIFLATFAFIIFPGPLDALNQKIGSGNALEHFMIDLQELEEGKVVFFDSDGAPKAWCYFEMVDDKVKCIELFTREGYHPLTNVRLRPIDPKAVRFIVRTKGLYLHPANIKKRSEKLAALSSVAIASESQKPPPKKTLAVITPPETSTQVDLSKPWKFRCKVFAGYPGYSRDSVSDWVPARIERLDSEIKIVILDPDGKEVADFIGTKNGSKKYTGSWSRRDNSGRGKFSCIRTKPGLITGSMNDVTVSQEFLDMRLKSA